MDEPESVVYAVRAGERVKIGTTRNLQKRLDGMQIGCPYPLELLGWASGNVALERALHRQFAKFRVSGEWFDLDEATLTELLARLAGKPHTIVLPKATRAAMTRGKRRSDWYRMKRQKKYKRRER